MTDEAARQFGAYLKDLRAQRKQSVRGLAASAGIDSGTVSRLEQGAIHAPSPDTLKQLSTALNVPLADLFTTVGYVTPQDLPSITPYIHAKYRHLPTQARIEIADYCIQRAAEWEDAAGRTPQEGAAQP